MSITTTDHETPGHGESHGDDGHGHGPAVEGAENPGGEHETAYKRDQKERLMLWLFIGGDLLFLVLEIFTWFYLRTLNVNGLWNGALCTKANPCTDGLGNPITAQIPKANPWHSVAIAVLTILCAAFIWLAESAAKKQSGKSTVTGLSVVGLLFLVGAVVWQCVQFGVLPFTTIQGAYASTFLFFIGSTLGHLILLLFVVVGLCIRAGKGRYEGGTWYRIRLIRFFVVWIAISTAALAIVSSLFY